MSVNDLLSMELGTWLDCYIEADAISPLPQVAAQFDRGGRQFRVTVEEIK